MDWNRVRCGFGGHVTYAPDEVGLRDALHVVGPNGKDEFWRCLRCGDFAPGAPLSQGPANEAPIVRRGRELRDAFIIRLLAIERLFRGVVLALLAYAVWRFKDAQASLSQIFESDLPAARPLAEKLGIDVDNSSVVAHIRHLLESSPAELKLIAIGLAAYGALELFEAVGLWLMKRWGEYVAVIATSIFIPLEIYELLERFTWFKLGAFVINVAAVAWLLYTKRLFGLRGGLAALEESRREDAIIEVGATASA